MEEWCEVVHEEGCSVCRPGLIGVNRISSRHIMILASSPGSDSAIHVTRPPCTSQR